MAINKKLIHFKSKENFDREVANENILDTSICFIQDSKEISTHGTIYKSVNWSVLTEQYSDVGCIVFITYGGDTPHIPGYSNGTNFGYDFSIAIPKSHFENDAKFQVYYGSARMESIEYAGSDTKIPLETPGIVCVKDLLNLNIDMNSDDHVFVHN